MDELDEICQENQLARYPVSRGRNSEESLLERYPELITSLEIDRQRRVDSMRLSSRRDQDELFDGKIRASVFDKSTPSSSVRKTKVAHSSEPSQSVGSPTLKARQSINDLMFQMDDDSTLSPTPVRKGKAPMTNSLAEDLDDLTQPPTLSFSQSQGDSLGDTSYLGAGVSSLRNGATGSLALSTPTIQPTPPTVTKGAPWVSPDISGDRRNLKDIMAETSTTRVSNLTLGMTDRSIAQSAGTFSQKMSQKERKRLQQIHSQEALEAQQKAGVDARQSPWQMVSKKPAPSPRADAIDKSGTSQPRSVEKPAMTLRQTVAGSPSIRPVTKPGPSPNCQGRSVSQPLPGPSTHTKPIPANTNPVAMKAKPSPSLSPVSTPQPIIQSIRHTPRPERSLPGPSGQASLASILLQQQAEKDEIREAASAKHKLQDIQAEQEFQEWWDKESKRVMEAEAAAAAAASQSPKGRNARRKNRGQQRQLPQSQSQSQQQQPREIQQSHKQGQNLEKSGEAPRSHGKRPNHRRPPKNSQPATGERNSRPEPITNQS